MSLFNGFANHVTAFLIGPPQGGAQPHASGRARAAQGATQGTVPPAPRAEQLEAPAARPSTDAGAARSQLGRVVEALLGSLLGQSVLFQRAPARATPGDGMARDQAANLDLAPDHTAPDDTATRGATESPDPAAGLRTGFAGRLHMPVFPEQLRATYAALPQIDDTLHEGGSTQIFDHEGLVSSSLRMSA